MADITYQEGSIMETFWAQGPVEKSALPILTQGPLPRRASHPSLASRTWISSGNGLSSLTLPCASQSRPLTWNLYTFSASSGPFGLPSHLIAVGSPSPPPAARPQPFPSACASSQGSQRTGHHLRRCAEPAVECPSRVGGRQLP